jgi:acyl carrier protein
VLLSTPEALARALGKPEAAAQVAVAGSLRRQAPETRTLLESLAAVHCRGATVTFARQHDGPRRLAPLPTYAWQRSRHWISAASGAEVPTSTASAPAPAPRAPTAAGTELRDTLARQTQAVRVETMEAFLRQELAAVLEIPAKRVTRDATFLSIGMDSFMSTVIRGRLEERLGLSLSAGITFSYPTLQALAAFLLKELGLTGPAAPGPAAAPMPAPDAAPPQVPLADAAPAPGAAEEDPLAAFEREMALVKEIKS